MLYKALLLCAGLTMLTSCAGPNPEEEAADAGMTPLATVPPPDATAHVSLAPTRGHTAAGMLMLVERADGVAVTGSITGLDPDARVAFHVHETGDCSAPDASSAGEHFNPTAQPHGGPDGTARHLGDLPNLDADDNGVAEVDVTIEGVTLTGPADRRVANRALVIHAGPDDYTTQPSGGSGDRIACGVIASDAMAVVPD